jgi:transcription elongation factor GreA
MHEHPRVHVTATGLRLLRVRLDAARAAYKAVCDDNPAARESGDSSVWHDNFAFEENQRLMHQLAARIRDLETELAHIILVEPLRAAPHRAVIGARVRYRIEGEAAPRNCTLVGHGEGLPEARHVAYDSPLGAALLGARPGDELDIPMAGRLRPAEVLAIDLADELPTLDATGAGGGRP